MAVAGCTKCIKYMLFFFNFIFWVSWTLFTLMLFVNSRFLTVALKSFPNFPFSYGLNGAAHLATHPSETVNSGIVSRLLLYKCHSCFLRKVQHLQQRHREGKTAARQELKTLNPYQTCYKVSVREGALHTGWASNFTFFPFNSALSILIDYVGTVLLYKYYWRFSGWKTEKVSFRIGCFLVTSRSQAPMREDTHKEGDQARLIEFLGGGGSCYPSDISFVRTLSPDWSSYCLWTF